MSKTEELEIELGELAKHHCACCEQESETVHGFLYDSTGATSVYFAGYTRGHPEHRVNMVLSVGGWGEGTTPNDRKAIALQIFCKKHDFEFVFPPAETSPWYGRELLGRMLRQEELSDEDRTRCRDLASVILSKDPRVSEYANAD